MKNYQLRFDAVQEAKPGKKWQARWQRSWPAYRQWFIARGGDAGPSRQQCEAAIKRHMPEISDTYQKLVKLAGNSDRAARFLSTWCPPKYLGGCSLAAMSDAQDVRLVRNYDLSPDLNEGLLFHSQWNDKKVMGMVEFLWGVSDGINSDGLSVALAYGGRSEVGAGFGITTILRYILEVAPGVDEALEILQRIPSHMAYNLVLADASGKTVAVEVQPGGGIKKLPAAFVTNHQRNEVTDRPEFTKTHLRYTFLEGLFSRSEKCEPSSLTEQFLSKPLFQTGYGKGFGTLFTAEYEPRKSSMTLHWQNKKMQQQIDAFKEWQTTIHYSSKVVQQPDNTDHAITQQTDDYRMAANEDVYDDETAYNGAYGSEHSSWLDLISPYVPADVMQQIKSFVQVNDDFLSETGDAGEADHDAGYHATTDWYAYGEKYYKTGAN